MTDTQVIELDTIVGPKQYFAPAGWDFGPTMRRRVWITLLRTVENERTHPKRDRPRATTTIKYRAQIDVLSNLLANDLGMSGWYWEHKAKEVAEGEGR